MTDKFNNYFSQEKDIKIIQECPVCGKPRRVVRARVLEESQINRLLYLTCSHCHSSIILQISMGVFGINSVGLITDLKPLEVIKFREAMRVTANNLVDLHNILNSGSIMNALRKL